MKFKELDEALAFELEEIGRSIFPTDAVYSMSEDDTNILAVNLSEESDMAEYIPKSWEHIRKTFDTDPIGFSFIVYLSESGVGFTLYETEDSTTVDIAGTNKFGSAPINDSSVELVGLLESEKSVVEALEKIRE